MWRGGGRLGVAECAAMNPATLPPVQTNLRSGPVAVPNATESCPCSKPWADWRVDGLWRAGFLATPARRHGGSDSGHVCLPRRQAWDDFLRLRQEMRMCQYCTATASGTSWPGMG